MQAEFTVVKSDEQVLIQERVTVKYSMVPLECNMIEVMVLTPELKPLLERLM